MLRCFALGTQRPVQSTLGAGLLDCNLRILRIFLVQVFIIRSQALGSIASLGSLARLPVCVFEALGNQLIAERKLLRAASLCLGFVGLLRVLSWQLGLVVLVRDVQICCLLVSLLPFACL